MPQAPARRATSESSDVAKLVRLHHRRRGWAWVAIGGLIGLVVYAGTGVNPFENLTGTAEILGAIWHDVHEPEALARSLSLRGRLQGCSGPCHQGQGN